MPVFSYAKREVNVKVVYYGPGLSGKTTNIQYIHDHIRPEFKGKLVSLATQTDRTLFFDFLPLEIGSLKGYKVRIHLYTVPGQVHYNATRKLVLKGVDGVVFVADSQRAMKDANLESYLNLEKNLQSYGKSLQDLPHIIQCNKRDLADVMGTEEMAVLLNRFRAPMKEVSAKTGEGVLDTLMDIVKRVMHSLKGQFQELEKAEEKASAESAERLGSEQEERLGSEHRSSPEKLGSEQRPAPAGQPGFASHASPESPSEPPAEPAYQDESVPEGGEKESPLEETVSSEENAPAPEIAAEEERNQVPAGEPELADRVSLPDVPVAEPLTIPAGGVAQARFAIPLPDGTTAEVTIELRVPASPAHGECPDVPPPSVEVTVHPPMEEKAPPVTEKVAEGVTGSPGRKECTGVETKGEPPESEIKPKAPIPASEEDGIVEADLLEEETEGYVPPEPPGDEFPHAIAGKEAAEHDAKSAENQDLFAPEEPQAPEPVKGKGILGFFRKKRD